MSDEIASAPVSPEGLSPTQTVAAETLASLTSAAEDAGDVETGDTGDPAPPVGDPAPAETPGVVKPAPSEAEQLLTEAGVTEPRRPDGRENRIPYSKVVKIIENGLKAGKGQFGQQFAAAQAEVTTYKGQMARVTPILKTLDAGPEAFIDWAAQHDPRWRTLREARTAPAAPVVPADLPEPDYALPDGSRTYSMKGIKEQLIPYIVQLAEKKAQAAAEAQYKPIAEREQAQRAEVVLERKANSLAADARTWEGFAEHEGAIVAALQAEPDLSLDAAYRRIVLPTFKADEAKIREKVLADLKAAPTGTAVSRGAEAVTTTKGKSTVDVARDVLRELNRGA